MDELTEKGLVVTQQMESRIIALEKNQARLDERLNALDQKIAENTETTNSIKADTSQMIALFKASQLGASLVKWCATVGGGAIVAYAAIKGLRN